MGRASRISPDMIVQWSKEYFDHKMSTHEIGRKHGVAGKTVREALVRAGHKLRSYAECQAILTERELHPRTGPRSEEQKELMRLGMHHYWNSMSQEEFEQVSAQRAETGRKRWEKMTDEEKQKSLEILNSEHANIPRKGSKGENFLAELLMQQSIRVERRTRQYTAPLELDIFLPDFIVAVEYDGPTHYQVIYSEEDLKKTIIRDIEKDEMLNSLGVSVIRVRDGARTFSKRFIEKLLPKIIAAAISARSSKPRTIVVWGRDKDKELYEQYCERFGIGESSTR